VRRGFHALRSSIQLRQLNAQFTLFGRFAPLVEVIRRALTRHSLENQALQAAFAKPWWRWRTLTSFVSGRRIRLFRRNFVPSDGRTSDESD